MAFAGWFLGLFGSAPDKPGAARSPRKRGGAPLRYDTPIWKAVEYVAGKTGETLTSGCPRACAAIRSNARAGKMKIRGRKQIASQSKTMEFNKTYSDIPPTYWANSILGPQATESDHVDDDHTWPETIDSWGPKGTKEPNRYAGLQVSIEEVRRLWR